MGAQPNPAGSLVHGEFHLVLKFIPATYLEVWIRMGMVSTLEVGDSDLAGARPKKEAHHE